MQPFSTFIKKQNLLTPGDIRLLTALDELNPCFFGDDVPEETKDNPWPAFENWLCESVNLGLITDHERLSVGMRLERSCWSMEKWKSLVLKM